MDRYENLHSAVMLPAAAAVATTVAPLFLVASGAAVAVSAQATSALGVASGAACVASAIHKAPRGAASGLASVGIASVPFALSGSPEALALGGLLVPQATLAVGFGVGLLALWRQLAPLSQVPSSPALSKRRRTCVPVMVDRDPRFRSWPITETAALEPMLKEMGLRLAASEIDGTSSTMGNSLSDALVSVVAKGAGKGTASFISADG